MEKDNGDIIDKTSKGISIIAAVATAGEAILALVKIIANKEK